MDDEDEHGDPVEEHQHEYRRDEADVRVEDAGVDDGTGEAADVVHREGGRKPASAALGPFDDPEGANDGHDEIVDSRIGGPGP